MVLIVNVACFLASLILAHIDGLDRVAKGSSFSAPALVSSVVIHNVLWLYEVAMQMHCVVQTRT